MRLRKITGRLTKLQLHCEQRVVEAINRQGMDSARAVVHRRLFPLWRAVWMTLLTGRHAHAAETSR